MGTWAARKRTEATRADRMVKSFVKEDMMNGITMARPIEVTGHLLQTQQSRLLVDANEGKGTTCVTLLRSAGVDVSKVGGVSASRLAQDLGYLSLRSAAEGYNVRCFRTVES